LKDFMWYADGKTAPAPPDVTGVVALWNAPTSGTHTIKLTVRDQGDLTATADCGSVLVP
jgi:hypothetical protein